MTAFLARAAMNLTAQCLGQTRREWARAMEAEFAIAVAEGKALSFAVGCLIAACREMPRHREGRFAFTNHAVALLLVLPISAVQLWSTGHPAGLVGMPDPADDQNPYLVGARLAATPSLLLLWLMLAMAQIRLAWLLVERDWAGVQRAGTAIVAGTATLAISLGVLDIEDARLALQAVFTMAEMTVMVAIVKWQGSNAVEPA